MTAPYSEEQRMREKYSNAPAEFADRPSAVAPAASFADVPVPAPAPEWRPGPHSAPSIATHEARNQHAPGPNDSNRSARIGVRTEGPQQGWRKYANRIPGVDFSKGEDEIAYDRAITQIRRPHRRSKTIGVVSGKGSSGKTITTIGMGATMATHHRGLKIVAASIDPLGNLQDRTRGTNIQPARSVVSMALDENLARDSDVGSYLLTDTSGLRVLGSSSADQAVFLTPKHLDVAHRELHKYFDIELLDFGLNIDSAVYHKGLGLVDQLVIVASTSADSIDELHKLFATLKRFGGKYVDLVQNAVVVFVQTTPGKGHIDITAERDRVVTNYKTPVVTIPWDEHISEGGPMSLDLLDKDTRLPFVWLAAEVMNKMTD